MSVNGGLNGSHRSGGRLDIFWCMGDAYNLRHTTHARFTAFIIFLAFTIQYLNLTLERVHSTPKCVSPCVSWTIILETKWLAGKIMGCLVWNINCEWRNLPPTTKNPSWIIGSSFKTGLDLATGLHARYAANSSGYSRDCTCIRTNLSAALSSDTVIAPRDITLWRRYALNLSNHEVAFFMR